MNVIALTLLISLCLAGLFVTCFIAECLKRNRSSPEQDSLLPLDDPTTLDPPQSSSSDSNPCK